MANLVLAYSDLYEEVEKYLGTYNSGSASATDLADAEFIVNRAYARYVSYYDWTFLSQHRMIETISGIYVYELPSDFSYLTDSKMMFDDDSGYAPTHQRSPGQIVDMRSNVVYNSYPLYFALQAGNYYKETGQGWEIMFYPTPDTKYPLKYFCKINPEKLEAATDIPIGGAEMSDCLLELCLAYAEAYKDERRAVHAATVDRILAPVKLMDNRRKPRELGTLNLFDNMFVDFENQHSGDVIVST